MTSNPKVVHVNIIMPEDDAGAKRHKRSSRRYETVVVKGNLSKDYIPFEEVGNISYCPICRKGIRGNKMKEHIQHCRQVLGSMSMYPCEICRNPFDRRGDKQAHFRECHPNVPLYLCNGCGSMYTEYQAFVSHKCQGQLSSGQLNILAYFCGGCDLKFCTRHSFDQHTKEMHKGVLRPSEVQHPEKRFFRSVRCDVEKKEGEEKVILTRKKGVRIISKVSASEYGSFDKRTKTTVRSKKTQKSELEWTLPSSPFPKSEPCLEEDDEKPSEVKYLRFHRAISRINSVINRSLPNSVTMRQPSGELLMDSFYESPSESHHLDENTGLLWINGVCSEIHPSPSDIPPFIDEEASSNYYKRVYSDFISKCDNEDDDSALPINIGWDTTEGSSLPDEPEPSCIEPDSRIDSPINHISHVDNPVSVTSHFKNIDSVANTLGITRVFDSEMSKSDVDVNGVKCKESSSEMVQKLSDRFDGPEDDEEVVPGEFQVFSDEEGRVIIVHPSGATSVAPPGSQVVQIDSGEIFILQTTDDGNTVAVPLVRENMVHIEDPGVPSTSLVLNTDGSLSLLLDSVSNEIQNQFLQSS
ncbi:uncharacterized protein LOC136035695 [Artemia franciscana]|uniref:C2H2-type domain-containing protein n=1 Tax=Artemia franciscana TaxID=6661 RepID=A0AA88IIK7_ARTSF|nr:hypothetical protein QYM36_003743 [Artemia franciscana]